MSNPVGNTERNDISKCRPIKWRASTSAAGQRVSSDSLIWLVVLISWDRHWTRARLRTVSLTVWLETASEQAAGRGAAAQWRSQDFEPRGHGVHVYEIMHSFIHSFTLYKIGDKTLLSNVSTTESHSMPNAVIKHHKIETVNGAHPVFLNSIRIK